MKLSYIIPVYKVEKYLEECVESILSQTMEDYEIILVDDGSPDSCPEMCDRFARVHPDIIRVVHKENGGLASARNAGLKVAKGDYIFFIDSDDYLSGDKVRQIYEKAVEFDADVLQTSFYTFEEDTGAEGVVRTSFETGKLLTHKDMEKELCYVSSQMRIIFVWRNLYKRDFLSKNGIVFEEKLLMVEDGPFNMQAYSKAERFVAVDIPVVCYRIRKDSLQRQKYVHDYDKWICWNWSLKVKYYSENCEPSQKFYEDIGEYTIKAVLLTLLENVYKNKSEESYKVLRRLGDSEMMRRSFADYDINKYRSKSFDWLITWFMKKKLYFFAHLICKFILYK